MVPIFQSYREAALFAARGGGRVRLVGNRTESGALYMVVPQ